MNSPPELQRLELRDAVYGAGLFAAALLVRVIVVQAFDVEPTWDGHYYHLGAESIAEGLGYSEAGFKGGVPVRLPWSHYPVGYSALLGAAYALFGTSAHIAPLVNSLIGALTAVVGYLFAFDLLGRTRGRVAGALVAFHPGLVTYCALVMTEPLAGFLVLFTALVARRFGHHRTAVVAAGVLLAASTFVRPQFILAAPLLALAFRGSLRQRLLRTGATTLLALALVAPWSVRNCLVLDGCAFVSTNGGWNLAIGALSETGRYQPLTPEDGCHGIEGPVAQDRCWAERGWAAIQRDPGAWLARIPDKLRHTYNHESFAIAYLAEAEPSAWERDRAWRVMNFMTAFHHALMLAAAMGALARFKLREWRGAWAQGLVLLGIGAFAFYALSLPQRPLFWVGVFIPVLGCLRLPGSPALNSGLSYLYGLLAVTTLTHMIFFGDDRYHLAVSPVFCILAAAAFRASAKRLAPAAGEPLIATSSAAAQ